MRPAEASNLVDQIMHKQVHNSKKQSKSGIEEELNIREKKNKMKMREKDRDREYRRNCRRRKSRKVREAKP